MVMTLHKSWHERLKEELKKPYISNLKTFLNTEKEKKAEIFPPENLVFNALAQTPYDEVKVVIMGQDPYHGYGQAEGLCFSVKKGVTIPPSLKNIYKEIKDDLGFEPPNHGSLIAWAKQGVLMLNATLTVRAKEPKSHYGKGWELFTDSIVRILCQREDPIIFLLWGKSAQEKCENILNKEKHSHIILTCAHPSPYSVSGFFGCRHFSKTNQYLANIGKTPINWEIR